MNDQVLADYELILDKFARWGWFVSPYYSGLEFCQLHNIAVRLAELDPQDHTTTVNRMMGDLLVKGNLNYHFRSIIVYEGYRVTPNMQRFSHLFEAGMLELYRMSFISCLGIWIPIIEGIVRSMLNINFGRFCRNRLRSLQAMNPAEQPFMDVLTQGILQFFEDTFYKTVRTTTDLDSQHLNRHFFSHANSHEPMYCRDNCLKLLNICDALLAIDFMLSSGFKTLFKGTDKRVKLREKYYQAVVQEAFNDTALVKTDLLADHPKFDLDFYYGGKSA